MRKKILSLILPVVFFLVGFVFFINGGKTAQAQSDITSPVISAVSASNITDTSAKITWTLDEPSTGQIEYGTTTSYGNFSIKETSFKYTTHIQTISGLSPGTTYNYRIISEDQAGNRVVSDNFIFKTLSAPCSLAPSNTGRVTLSTTVSEGGIYRAWSRMKAANSSDNSFLIQIDSECPILVGDSSLISSADWTWVNYQNGSSANKIDVNLTSGNHVITLIGKENNVSVDKVLLTKILSCVPTGFGDNCPVIADITPPVISAVSASNITDTSAKITWTLDEPASGQVSYGTTSSYGQKTTFQTCCQYSNHVQDVSGLTNGTTYHYKIASIDEAGNKAFYGDCTFVAGGATTQNCSITPAGGGDSQAFIELGGSVTMEAENYNYNAKNGSTYAWNKLINGVYPAVGEAITFMKAAPNDDKKTYFANSFASAPEISYNINFTKIGTYYVYMRSSGPDAKSDSVHYGLDEQYNNSAALYYEGEGGKTAVWQWKNSNNDSTRAKISVTTPGIHKFNIWMREDGTKIDRIRLSQNKDWTPSVSLSDFGPAESEIRTITILRLQSIKLHGIGSGGDNTNPNLGGNYKPLKITRPVTIDLEDKNGTALPVINGSVSFNSKTGDFSGDIALPDTVSAGNYLVKVKSPQYLRKQAAGIITISKGEVNTIPAVSLITGDIDNSNTLTILDYNLLIDCYSDILPAKNCNDTKKPAADLSDDGNVNANDYNLFLRELSVTQGD